MSFSFDNIRQTRNDNANSVGYFALKNDGDSAVVRFMHDTVESLDMVDLHDVQINNKRRRVGCVRTGTDPLDKCPLCSAGLPFRQRLYVHLIEYVKDASGNVTPTPRVWDRPASYAYKLRDFINNYGPLSKMLFTIKRNGAAGDTATTYTEMPAMPAMYPPQLYPEMPGAFENFQALGNIVINRSAADMRAFLETGNFPAPTNKSAQNTVAPSLYPAANNPAAYQQNSAPAYQAPVSATPAQQMPTPAVTPANTPQTLPWETNQTPTMSRPVRYY